jgi:hypothetical protein
LWSLDSKDWKRLTSRWLRLKLLAILGLWPLLARIELPFANYLAAALQHFPSEKAIHLKIDGVPIFHAVGALTADILSFLCPKPESCY